MATRKFGKLKINKSEDGFAFRFGEGKIHNLSLRRKAKDAAPEDYNDDYNEDYNEEEEFMNEENYSEDEFYAQDDFYAEDEYTPGDDFVPKGYSGRFAQKSAADDYQDDYRDYGDDGYADDYAGDDLYDDRYDDGYADDYAEDDRYDDGYADEDGYYNGEEEYYGEEGDYADEEGDYDDRYYDEDAEAYDDAAYADESPLIRYIDENAWVTYVLLFLLPPLGIYLLWTRRRFEKPIRWGVSAASALWFIILIVLLISLIFSGSGDTTTNPPITMTSPTPTVEPVSTPGTDGLIDAMNQGGISDTDGITPAQTQDMLAIDATATPIAGYNGGNAQAVGNTVIMTATGLYYHNNSECENIESGASISNVTKDVAQQRGKGACPICYPDTKTYYATSGGKYYHVVINCSGMDGASVITEEIAKSQGKSACPVCIKKEVNSLSSNALRYINAETKDQSGITVYGTSGGRYFHTDPTCSGMKNARSAGLKDAMLAGKTPCPDCAAEARTKVWCTKGGKYFHNKSNCSGMEGAYQVSLAEAMVLGKDRCKTCWGKSTVASNSSSSGSSSLYVYGTKSGKYYHTNANCSGMTGASRYPLSSFIKSGRAACPVCCAGADAVVYATSSGEYYHSYAGCGNMKNAKAGTLAQALALGKKKCPECWSSSESKKETASSSTIVKEPTADGSYVYATKSGSYYHTKSSCSGMTGASKVTIATAVSAGKKACPTCASAANYTVYSKKGGTYYHSKASCSGMENAPKRTLEDAVMMDQKACPVCIGKDLSVLTSNSTSGGVSNVEGNQITSEKMTSSGTYKSGTSGIKVYATADGKNYHTTSSCSGMKDASYVTLETALNYGKTACSKCASTANTAVYAVKGGKYYHYSKTCAGSGAVQGKRAQALALGMNPCPYCVTKTKAVTVSSTYKAGTSGIKVYASVSGKYFHADKSCAGSGASKITLETALNYGKSACPSCASSAKKTVYSSGSDKYYHTSKAHAGSDAVSGSFAKALAMGKKECPNCIGGSEAYEVSDIKYSAPGDTNVYIDLDSSMLYYHKGSRCKDADVSGGTKVTLDFVVSWGYKACPFCNPPTSVS